MHSAIGWDAQRDGLPEDWPGSREAVDPAKLHEGQGGSALPSCLACHPECRPPRPPVHAGLFDCKPLAVLWARYPQYGPHNTIMLGALLARQSSWLQGRVGGEPSQPGACATCRKHGSLHCCPSCASWPFLPLTHHTALACRRRPAPQLRAEQAEWPGHPPFQKGRWGCARWRRLPTSAHKQRSQAVPCTAPPRTARATHVCSASCRRCACRPALPAAPRQLQARSRPAVLPQGQSARCAPRSPHAQAHLTRTTDRELLYLSGYLSKIAQLDSLEALNHRQEGGGGAEPQARGRGSVLQHLQG